MNKAVAVVGMCGSGKSLLCDYFCEKGWQSVYFGGVTMSQLKLSGLPVNEQNERLMRESLRRNLGMGAFALLLKDEILAKLQQSNVVLDGLYSWSEYLILKEALGESLVLLAVVTDCAIRKQRLATRKIRPLTAAEVDARDKAEIEHSEKGGPIAKADHFVINNGTEAQLKEQFETFVATL